MKEKIAAQLMNHLVRDKAFDFGLLINDLLEISAPGGIEEGLPEGHS